MKPQHQLFADAYLTTAKGNATEAAKLAGYSPKTAGQIGSRLLKHPAVKAAVAARLEKADLTTQARLLKLAKIADTNVQSEKVSASDVINANALILKVNGALRDKSDAGSRITVNIGFLHAGDTQPLPALTVTTTDDRADTIDVVMPSQPQVARIGGDVGRRDS